MQVNEKNAHEILRITGTNNESTWEDFHAKVKLSKNGSLLERLTPVFT